MSVRNPYWNAQNAADLRDDPQWQSPDGTLGFTPLPSLTDADRYGTVSQALTAGEYVDFVTVNLVAGHSYRFVSQGASATDLAIFDQDGYMLVFEDEDSAGEPATPPSPSIMDFVPSYSGLHVLGIAFWNYEQLGAWHIEAYEDVHADGRNNAATPGSLSILAGHADRAEGNAGATSFTFTISRQGGLAVSQSVSWQVQSRTLNGDASSGVTAGDFVGGGLPSGTVTFAPGEASRTITVQVLGDTLIEGDEGFAVLLHDPSGGAALDAAEAAAVIRSDDLAPSAPAFPVLRAAQDFNGDRLADILWRHDAGWVSVWAMNGTGVKAAATAALNPDGWWQIHGTGDFNGDSRDDILWRGQDGTISIWHMDGAGIVGGGNVALNPGSWWTPVGAGDFDGNGRSDILWRGADGTVCIWGMDGTSIVSGGIAALNPGTEWSIVAVGDFNGDSRDDILWRHADGSIAVWDMVSNAIVGGGILGLNPGTGWTVMGAEDFNGDGRSDILWRGADGSVCVWLMHDTTIIGGGIVGLNPGSFWQIEGFGDFSGDGRSDILWRGQDGTAVLWQMDGAVIVGGGAFAVIGNDWQMGPG